MRLHALAVALAASGTLGVTHAQQAPSPAAGASAKAARSITVYQLGPFKLLSDPNYAFTDVYFLGNGGATALAVMTAAGPVLLDAKLPGWGPAVLDALHQVTDMPLTTIINTHGHEDHAGADSEYPRPVEVVMHENSVNRLKGRAGTGTVRTFRDQTSLTIGDVTFRLYYFGKGHTDGDTIVVLPDHKTAYVGDLFAEKAVPVIDPASGGSALALPQTLARAAAAITDVDYVITGHTPTPQGRVRNWPTWKDFVQYSEFTRDFVAAATAAWKNGRTAEQAVSELTLPDKYKDYRMEGAKATVDVIFNELRSSAQR